MSRQRFTLRFDPDEGDAWVARCAEVPGLESRGKTLDEARTQLRAALVSALSAGGKDGAAIVDQAELVEEVGL